MNYQKEYSTRSNAKTHKTRKYEPAELNAIRELIRQYITDTEPNIILNTNEANYAGIADTINKASGEEILTARFICDIYNQNTCNQKKSIKKVNAIIDYINAYYDQRQYGNAMDFWQEATPVLNKVEEIQRDLNKIAEWMKDFIVEKSNERQSGRKYHPIIFSTKIIG